MFRNPIEILMSLPAVFLAMSFHEYAHALTAVKLGDPTPRNHGRLTLDPLVHVDWTGLILFALFGYGWARPVQVNPSNLRGKRWGHILVSLSGPMANLMLAAAAAVLHAILLAFSNHSAVMSTILSVINYIVLLNAVFFFLNLIPIPPFDGYHIVRDLFFRRFIRFFMGYERIGIYILFAFVLFGLIDMIIGWPSSLVYRFLMTSAQSLVSLFQ